jgi:hypothetical protein
MGKKAIPGGTSQPSKRDDTNLMNDSNYSLEERT